MTLLDRLTYAGDPADLEPVKDRLVLVFGDGLIETVRRYEAHRDSWEPFKQSRAVA